MPKYIKGSKKDLESDLTALAIERLLHERSKFNFYDTWYLNYTTFRSNLFSGYRASGVELWRTLPISSAKMVERKLQPVINRITPIVDYYVGSLSQNIISRVVPEYTTERAVRHARVKEEGLQYFYRECGLAEKQNLASMIRIIMGDAFLKVVWDDQLKPNCQCYEKWLIEKNALLNEIERGLEEGNAPRIMTAEEMGYYEDFDEETHCDCRGFPAIDVLTPWDVIFNREANSMEKVDWWTHAYRFNCEKAKDHFNRDEEGFYGNGDKLELAGTPSNETLYIERAISPRYNRDVGEEETECFIEETYEKPTPEYPKGRLIITGNEGKTLLFAGPLPWNRYHRMNIFKLGFKQNAGTIWSDTLISKIVPTQNEVNDLFGRVKDILRKFALIKLITAQQHNLKGDWTNDPSDVVKYDGTSAQMGIPPPAYMQLPNPPSFSGDIMTWMVKEIEILSGYFEMQKGMIPSEVKSGVMFDRAMEQSNKKLKAIADRDIVTYNQFYSFLLSLIEEKMAPEWWERFTGQGRAKHIYSYDKDFKATTFNVRCEPMSVHQMSVASQSEFLMQLIDRGAFMEKPKLMHKALKLLGYGGLFELFEMDEVAELNAREEQESWKATGVINDWNNMPYPYENLEAHMDEHTSYMETQEFREEEQDKRMVFIQHVRDTEEELNKKIMEAAKRQQAMFANMGSPPKQRPAEAGGRGEQVGPPPQQ